MPAVHNLDAETVVDIFLASGPQKVVALRYGVTQSTVSNIKRRRTHRAATAAWDPLEGAEMVNGMLASLACGWRPI